MIWHHPRQASVGITPQGTVTLQLVGTWRSVSVELDPDDALKVAGMLTTTALDAQEQPVR